MNYTEYYSICLEINSQKSTETLHNFDISIKSPDTLPNNYKDTIQSIADKVNKLFENKDNCIENNMCKNIPDIYNIPEIETVAQYFGPYLEENLFHCPVHLDRVYIYRNIITNKKAETSWLWHWDHHPKEIIKVLIYLVDVDENSGPFEYLEHSETKKAIKMETNRLGMKKWGSKNHPKYPNSRLSEQQIKEFEKEGYVRNKVVGERGTAIIFDNNIVHRANIPKDKIRDVLVLQFRPCMEKRDIYLDKKTTGNCTHNAVTKDPTMFEVS